MSIVKRASTTVLLIGTLLGGLACGGPEDLAGSEGELGVLRFASTEAAGMYLNMAGTAYTGLAGGGGACSADTDFTGVACALLDGAGTTVATDLCLGSWDFTGIAIHDAADTTCTGAAIALCDDVTSYTVSPGVNSVSVTCWVEGADVTFDITLN